jgi:glycopeptide antibiotics resistance protein
MTEINHTSGVNLMPFSEILRYKVGTKMFYYNVLGNILIFIPFGYLFSIYVRPKKGWSVLITTIILSAVVEFVQLKIGRSFDIDDIILNVVGGIIGYLLYISITAINRRLPDLLKSDTLYDIICIIIIILFGIYIFGFWKVVF